MVTDEQCAACDFNKPGKTCLRKMEWVWRGEHYSATSAEYNSIKAQLASESFPPAAAGGPVRSGYQTQLLLLTIKEEIEIDGAKLKGFACHIPLPALLLTPSRICFA